VRFLPILLTLLAGALALVAVGAYYVWSWGVRGQTIGQTLAGVAVVGPDGDWPIGVGRAATRVLGYALSGGLLGAGFLMAAATGIGLHDRLAQTRVVRRRS